jgi:hypothetical protein
MDSSKTGISVTPPLALKEKFPRRRRGLVRIGTSARLVLAMVGYISRQARNYSPSLPQV